ncbi:N-acetylmuramoyl-L-alanine amidase [Oceanithermus sp.]
MVLKRSLSVWLCLVILTLGPAFAQEAKPLLVGGETLEAVYPGNFGVSYTEAKPFAQALGLAYWQDDARVILGLGSLQIRLPLASIPKSRTYLKTLVTKNPPHALRDRGKILLPVRYIAKALGFAYSGSDSSLKVIIPEANLRGIDVTVTNGRDVLSLKFNRNVNLVRMGQGHWLLLGVRAEEGMRYLSGLYLTDVRLQPGPYGAELYLDGVEGWPEEVAYYPQEARIFVGQKASKPPEPPLIVIDPGHGGSDLGATYGNLYEKDIVLKVARETADILARRGYRVRLTRSRDETRSIYERAQLAAKADVFLSLHVAGDPVSPPGPSIYTYTGAGRATPVFTSKSRALLAGGGYKKILLRYAAAPSRVEAFARGLEAEFGRIGLSVRRGQSPLYLLERAPGAAALVELGSIYNNTDRARMSNSAQQSAYAQVLARAVENYLGGVK